MATLFNAGILNLIEIKMNAGKAAKIKLTIQMCFVFITIILKIGQFLDSQILMTCTENWTIFRLKYFGHFGTILFVDNIFDLRISLDL